MPITYFLRLALRQAWDSPKTLSAFLKYRHMAGYADIGIICQRSIYASRISFSDRDVSVHTKQTLSLRLLWFRAYEFCRNGCPFAIHYRHIDRQQVSGLSPPLFIAGVDFLYIQLAYLTSFRGCP